MYFYKRYPATLKALRLVLIGIIIIDYHDRPRPSTTAGDPWDVDPAVIKRPSPVVTQHQQQQQQQFIDLLKKKTAEQVI